MYQKPKYSKGPRFYPNFIMDDVLVIFVFLVVFSGLVFFFPDLIVSGDENIRADPFDTPEHIKPEWYFLASYQFLKLIPSEFGALVIQTIGILLFVFLPFIDRSKESNILKRPFFLLLVLFFLFGSIGLTVWGYFS